jgi:hypothetical protein
MTRGRIRPLVSRMISFIVGFSLAAMAMMPAAGHADPVDDYIATKMAAESIPGLALANLQGAVPERFISKIVALYPTKTH